MVIDWKTWSQKVGTFTSVLVDDQIHSAIYSVHFSFLQWNILVTSVTIDLWSIIKTIFWMNYVHMFTVNWFIYSHVHVCLKHICINSEETLGNSGWIIELQYPFLVVQGWLDVAKYNLRFLSCSELIGAEQKLNLKQLITATVTFPHQWKIPEPDVNQHTLGG